MKTNPLLSLFVCAFFQIPLFAGAETLQAKVTAVHDGDTMNVILQNGQTARVRLLGTDSPEVDFNHHSQGPAAFKARDFLASLAPVGSEVVIVTGPLETDKHDRILGTILRKGLDVNAEMLKNGWSVFYVIAPYDKSMVRKYSALSKAALEQGRGIFSEAYRNVAVPYQFRMQVKGMEGHNVVGDLESGRLYSPEDVDKVPVYNRIFFPSDLMATRNGYRW